jgi:protein farnesyltransferase subunit beta
MDKENTQNEKKYQEHITKTLVDQRNTENSIINIFQKYGFEINDAEAFTNHINFNPQLHYNYAAKMIYNLPPSFKYLDSGMPWFTYWILNILEITNVQDYELPHSLKLKFVDILKELQHSEGGFRGYSYGIPHLASNYAAILAICLLGIKEAYEIINVEKMRKYLKSMKNNNTLKEGNSSFSDFKGNFILEKEDVEKLNSYRTSWPGAFQMHSCGESDLRATYCALIVADILNIIDDELTKGVVENIRLCQTVEGGLGPEPFCEAHGGYTFCGVASLILLNKLDVIDINKLLYWLTNRQMSKEGGFSGRTNKLVDSCYSFWQASVFSMITIADKERFSFSDELLFNQLALQSYITLCCQESSGGLMDKPGTRPDLFHTNYSLCGLSLSETTFIKDVPILLGDDPSLELNRIHPVYSINGNKVTEAKKYFKEKK